MSDSVDYLEVDNPIPGQHYVCISFVSPESVLKDKELFMFSKFVSQRSGEVENKVEKNNKSIVLNGENIEISNENLVKLESKIEKTNQLSPYKEYNYILRKTFVADF